MRTFIGAAQLTGQLTAFEPTVQYPGFILRYCPDGIYNDGNTMPLVMVYGSEAFTEDSAKAALEQWGLAALAADASCNVLFMSPVEGAWGPKDKELYLSVVSGVDHNFGGENGIKDAFDFRTRQPVGKKLLGNEGMVYLLGDGSGADFIAENLLGDGLTSRPSSAWSRASLPPPPCCATAAQCPS